MIRNSKVLLKILIIKETSAKTFNILVLLSINCEALCLCKPVSVQVVSNNEVMHAAV